MAVNWITRMALLIVALLGVFLAVTFDAPRRLLGTQFDVRPALMVYAGLSGDLWSIGLLSVCGGAWFDAFSMNPLGTSILPLFAVGLAVHLARDFILSDQASLRMMLGGVASAVVPALTLLLLWTVLATKPPASAQLGWELTSKVELGPEAIGQWVARPIGGIRIVEQLVVMAGIGALITPLLFLLFDGLNRAFNYPVSGQTSFRADREIKRGRYI